MSSERQDGTSLVEALVSVAIFSFLALAVMSGMTTALHLNKLGEERSAATALAAERIQAITSSDFQSAANYASYALPEETVAAGPPPTFTTDYGEIPEHPRQRREVELEYDAPAAGMLKVKVTVWWRHIDQTERSHTMIEILHPELE